MVEDYAPGTVIRLENRILLYVGANTHLHSFKELLPNSFRPQIETEEGYERIKREAKTLGVLHRPQLIEISHKNANLEKLLKRYHIL